MHLHNTFIWENAMRCSGKSNRKLHEIIERTRLIILIVNHYPHPWQASYNLCFLQRCLIFSLFFLVFLISLFAREVVTSQRVWFGLVWRWYKLCLTMRIMLETWKASHKGVLIFLVSSSQCLQGRLWHPRGFGLLLIFLAVDDFNAFQVSSWDFGRMPSFLKSIHWKLLHATPLLLFVSDTYAQIQEYESEDMHFENSVWSRLCWWIPRETLVPAVPRLLCHNPKTKFSLQNFSSLGGNETQVRLFRGLLTIDLVLYLCL